MPRRPQTAGSERDALQTWIHGWAGGRPGADTRLLCFPFAGGGASAFGGWAPHFPASVEICAIQYPGRESRWGEASPGSLDGLVLALAEDLAPLWRMGSFAFLGHSYGALVAFELAHALAARGLPLPGRLFLSGARAPHLEAREPIHGLPDGEFLARLRKYDGIPDEILRDHDLMAIVLPILRNDFRLFERHPYRGREPLPVPLSVFGGLGDASVPIADLLAWSVHTGKAFRSRFFAGNHFFAFEAARAIAEAVVEDLAASGAASTQAPVRTPAPADGRKAGSASGRRTA
jgi:medium-chain acyl-[acyl-carrier-protein] hydrolase